MSKESIKRTIDDNIFQNGQQRITGSVMNSVLNEMVENEYGELNQLALKVDESAEKSIEDSNSDKIEVKVNALINAFSELITKVVFHTSGGYQLPMELRNALALTKYDAPTSKAICGQCLCGEVICGN